MPMMSRRVVPVLELTRMALVFTAIADSWTTLLLRARLLHGESPGVWGVTLNPRMMVEMAIISAGLYAFGVSLNDIIDRRRDQQFAAHRPLPSGRIGVRSAHLICAGLVGAAIIAGASYSAGKHDPTSFLLVLWTALLITLYDFAGKYLVGPGLLALGLIRLFHVAIASPDLPLLWHPLLLMNHVVIVSTLAYVFEQKRPAVTRTHRSMLIASLAMIDAILIGLFYLRRSRHGASFGAAMWITPGLMLPVAAVVGFVVIALIIKHSSRSYRDLGSRLGLAGLLWLIVYDAAFVWGYVSFAWAVVIIMLLPVAYIGLKILSLGSGIAALTRRPEYRRAE